MANENQKFWTQEWSIENFSCWNLKLHGAAISNGLVIIGDFKFRIDLYPKGLDGHGDYILARIFDVTRKNGELIFISSDGSIISKLEMKNPEWVESSTLLSTELKFKDILSKMERDPLHKDVITLRYRRSGTPEIDFSVCNKIDVIEKFAEIAFDRLKILPWDFSSILFIRFGEDSKLSKTIARLFQSDSEKLNFEFKLTQLPKSILIKCNFYSLNSAGDLLKSEEIERIFEKEDTWKFSYTLPPKEVESSLFMRLKFVTGKKSENYTCHFSQKNLKFKNSNFLKVRSKNPEKQPVSVLLNQLMSAYQDSDFSDFQLCCGGASFPVHKVILCARSPVFKAMLTSDMRETTSGSADIEDLDPHTLGRFLAFLYTGTIEDLEWESALKLYYAADKYHVPSLKKECSTVLKNGVAVTNVCDILSLVDRYEDDELMSVVTDFISENYGDILISSEWKCFMLKDPLLLCKSLTASAEKKAARKK